MSERSAFTILHVCMGNICRSPMAERLLRRCAGERAHLIHTESAGTGGWHAGEAMNPPAGREVRRRGGDSDHFTARKLTLEHLDAAGLVLTATAEQSHHVNRMRPAAAGRTFVLGEFGRLLRDVDLTVLPPYAPDVAVVHARAVALVAAVDKAREGVPPQPGDDLDDPWGCGDAYFARVAEEIERTVRPLIAVLLT